jgi:hypothetical protein
MPNQTVAYGYMAVGEAEESAPLVYGQQLLFFPFAAAEQIPHLRV